MSSGSTGFVGFPAVVGGFFVAVVLLLVFALGPSIAHAVSAALVAGFVSIACNTVQGLGKDLEKGGEAIQKVAK